MKHQLASVSALSAHEPSRRQFFFSECLPRCARNVHHVYASVEKLGAVFADESGARRGVSGFCGTAIRPDGGGYRLYHTVIDRSTMRIAIAESPDGLEWKKTPLGQEKRPGFEDNMIVFSGVPSNMIEGKGGINQQDHVAQPQVLRLPDGSWRMYYWHHQHGWGRMPYVYTVAVSDDGLVWRVQDYSKPVLNSHFIWEQADLPQAQLMAAKSRRTNDANFVYWNPRLGCYEQFSQWLLDAAPERRVEEDNCPAVSRMIQRRTSSDGLDWSAPELVIQADERDPWDQQFYHLSVQYHDHWYIGGLGHYRVEQGQQSIALELAFSRDGREWHRPVRGGFIPSEPGGLDGEMVLPPNAWIDEGESWLCLYTGVARKHNQHDKQELPPSRIMAARWPKNRFVGLAAGRVSGLFMSDVFFPGQPSIMIDADIRGWLRAELCDAWGRKLDGRNLADSALIQGNGANLALAWRGSENCRALHDPVRVRFEFADGVVYGLHC